MTTPRKIRQFSKNPKTLKKINPGSSPGFKLLIKVRLLLVSNLLAARLCFMSFPKKNYQKMNL